MTCTGALFVYRGTPAEELAMELGIRTVAFTPDTYGIHVGGETVVDGDNDRLIDRLPISRRPRASSCAPSCTPRSTPTGGRRGRSAFPLLTAPRADSTLHKYISVMEGPSS